MYPELFSIRNFTIHSYYVLWIVALVTAFLWTYKRGIQYYGIPPSKMGHLLGMVALGIIAGICTGMGIHLGREAVFQDPLSILHFWKGGMSSYYSCIGGCCFAFFYIFRTKLSLWRVAESASLPSAALIAIGRWGCFLNGCCGGIPTSHLWGVRFAIDPEALIRHPTQLYYSFGALAILLALQWIEFRLGESERFVKAAFLWPLFLILWGFLRIFVDPLRIDWYLSGIEASHRGSFSMVIVGGIWLSYSCWKLIRKIYD